MNHLIWPVSLVGILSTAVVFGTDMFFLTVGRPALRLASPAAGTEVMGFFHVYGDARMPIWGVLAILSNLLLGLLTRGGHRGRYLLTVSVLILFVVLYNRLSKPIKNGRKARQRSRAAGVVGSIGDDPYSAARCVTDRPVPSIANHFGVNASACSLFKSKEKAHVDNCGFMACSPTCGHFPTLRLFPDNGKPGSNQLARWVSTTRISSVFDFLTKCRLHVPNPLDFLEPRFSIVSGLRPPKR